MQNNSNKRKKLNSDTVILLTTLYSNVADVADNIKQLCEGKKDNIVYGFELGKIYNELIEIKSQLWDITQ